MILLLWTSLFISGCFGQLDVCGRPPLNTRIVGGQDAPAGHWPWQASVHRKGSYICGGSLINKQWVLSAASCFSSVFASELEVYLGRQNQSGSNSNELKMTVSRIVSHASHNVFATDNNIALLQLNGTVSFTNYIRPVCLAASGSLFPGGVTSWVTGWGNTDSGDSFPSPGLRQVQVAVIENTQCNSVHEGNLITDNQICAVVLAGGKDFCKGQSGGPLVSKQDSAWVQLGVASPGNSCEQPSHPGIYTRVSRYQTWISDHITTTTNAQSFVLFTGTPPVTTPPSVTSATTDIGSHCQLQPKDKIAVPMITSVCLVMAHSASSDLRQLKQVITEEIDKSSKEYKDPLYLSTKFLEISQSNKSENQLRVEIKQWFQLAAGKICLHGNETVTKVLRHALTPHFDKISIISIEGSACVVVTFQIDIPFEEALTDHNSEEFKNLEKRIIKVIDHVTSNQYGIFYKRTVVLGFRPKQMSRRTKRNVMETEVELQEEFDPVSTSSFSSDSSPNFPRRSDVMKLLRVAAANSTLGFTLDLDSVSLTVPVQSRAQTCRQDAIGAWCLTVLSLLILWTCLAH